MLAVIIPPADPERAAKYITRLKLSEREERLLEQREEAQAASVGAAQQQVRALPLALDHR